MLPDLFLCVDVFMIKRSQLWDVVDDGQSIVGQFSYRVPLQVQMSHQIQPLDMLDLRYVDELKVEII